MIGITPERIRSLISKCHTEMEVASALRSHKVKYTFTTETGFLALRVPCRKGCIRIYRACSRTAPFMVQAIRSGSVHPVPVIRSAY